MKHLISVPPIAISHFHKMSGLSPDNWFVASDPEKKRVGSGGGTSYLLSELWKKEGGAEFSMWLENEKRVIIHAGGKSRRLPAYAPAGKSLMPMPVFRWSRGQNLNQRLINLQAPLFDKILNQAPAKLNTLIASGDTLIFEGKTLPEIPEADVVCFGLWLEPEKATNHGVFFANHENPTELQFMLQKPSIKTIRELIHDYYFLMDIGIWLLSPKAINILMRKSGWNENDYKNKFPDDYDMYSQFGTALGVNPAESEQEISELKVALVNLEGGEFYHLGNTAELVSSNLAIQNRIIDQREIWHKNIKPHPSIFVLNAETGISFSEENKNIWIENSTIPGTWKINENHALTGIPENSWKLNLEKGKCIDFVPLDEKKIVIRNYGFTDNFRGAWTKNSTQFNEMPLIEWLKNHKLKEVFDELSDNTDIQSVSLFPVVEKESVSEKFIQWLLESEPADNIQFSNFWKEAKRLSADEISELSNLEILEKQRQNYHLKNVSLLAKNYRHSVFYQLDLEKLADEYLTNNLELPEKPKESAGDWLPIHDSMFRAVYLRKKGLGSQEEENEAFTFLQEKVLEEFRQKKVNPEINLLTDQIAWGRSPIRLDLAGGWTDTPPYCMLYGGKVLNMAAELNGQPPLHCYIKRTDKNEIVLRSIDLGARETITSFDQLRSFYNIQSAFSIPKTALALAGYLPEFCERQYTSLENQLSQSGGGLEISILAAVPKGSGLGTSSILAATVLGTLSEVCQLNWDKLETGKRVLALEQLLTTGGGWQDQYGGLLEGIKFLETQAGKRQEPKVKWLPDNLFVDPVHKNKMLLYYTGITRVAKNILAEIVRGMFLNSSVHLSILNELKQHATQTYEYMLKKDYDALGKQIHKSWLLNQSLDSGTNTPEIQEIIDKIEPYMIGQKLLGAGGGGFMLIMANDELSATLIKQILTAEPVNNRARFIDFEISQTGLQVTKS